MVRESWSFCQLAISNPSRYPMAKTPKKSTALARRPPADR
jgi:hypothetical protein